MSFFDNDIGFITNNANNTRIVNLANPIADQDAATKAYVDLLLKRIKALEKILGVIIVVEEDPVTDYDGNVYNAVRIGEQVWTTENLNVTHYRNGDPIPNVSDNTEWINLRTGARCYYDNDSATYSDTYGSLYNYYTVADPRNLCPTGWHVPSDAEWTTLETYLGGITYAGGKMKETGTTHWKYPNTGASNESHFTALPGGYRTYNDGRTYGMGDAGYWWSSTEYITLAISWSLGYSMYNISRDQSRKWKGYSVRCIRDD